MAEKPPYRLTLRYFDKLHGMKQPIRIPKLTYTRSDLVLQAWFKGLTNAEQRATLILERWCGLEAGSVPDSKRWLRKHIGCNERVIESLMASGVVVRFLPNLTATVVGKYQLACSRLGTKHEQVETKRTHTGTPKRGKSGTYGYRLGIMNNARTPASALGGAARRLGDVAEAFEWSTTKGRIKQLVRDGKNEAETRMVLAMTLPESYVDDCMARYELETKNDAE